MQKDTVDTRTPSFPPVRARAATRMWNSLKRCRGGEALNVEPSPAAATFPPTQQRRWSSPMETIEQYLPHHPFFTGMSHQALSEIAACGRVRHVSGGSPLFYQGDHADAMYVVRTGRLELRVHRRSSRGMTIDTVNSGDVLGWSWLVPPHRWMFDAFAVQDSDVIVLDGGCLRAKIDADPALGYVFLSRVTHVMHQRLEAARARLIEHHEGFHGHLH